MWRLEEGGWMAVHLNDREKTMLATVMDLLVPRSGELGGADYVDQLLGAFTWDPPHIWAGGPFSGRHGGDAGFERWLELGTAEELAWRTRIEGSRGLPEREWNGPVIGWQEIYRDGLGQLGDDFSSQPPEEQRRRLDHCDVAFRDQVFDHACESLYGDPVYGGNRDGEGWASIGFAGDTQPRGWTDAEVTFGG
jgi:hypothetical protein